jgi:hypothetical protein
MAAKKKAAKTVEKAAVVHRPKTGYMLEVNRMEPVEVEALRRIIITGDLSVLSVPQRDQYYISLCDAMGVDWRLRPFEYITLNQKLVLYGRSNLAEQLRNNRRINIGITERKQVGDVFMVIARAEMNGRFDESSGVVDVRGKGGEMLANLIMKAETKAKRRVTLSICGAGMLDETEVEDSQPGAGLPQNVQDHLFGPKKPAEVEAPKTVEAPLTPQQAAAADDAEKKRVEDEAAAQAREARIITTIEKWKKSDDGKEAMSLCVRLGLGSKSAMYKKYEDCNSDFENFCSVLRDEIKKKDGK